jgi:AraC-like DNA-binding protein
MGVNILIHANASITLLTLIIIVDLSINLKKPISLKVFLLTLTAAILIINLAHLFKLHYFFVEISRILVLISSINIISLLISHKLKKDIANSTLFIFLFSIFLMIGIDYAKSNNILILTRIFQFCRILVIILGVYLFTKLFKVLSHSLNQKTVYSIKIKKWIQLTILLFSIGMLNNFTSIFLGPDSFIIRGITFIVHLGLCIFLLYRPSFLNKTELSLTLGNTFTKKTDDDISYEDFADEFFKKEYFIKHDANFDDFSKKFEIKPDNLNAFIFETTKMNFSDLINKSRIDYFINLIKSQKYKDYTIYALSEMTGFGTRQTLYRNFKKFHGGNPTDLFRDM